jgi:hypothetical protein
VAPNPAQTFLTASVRKADALPQELRWTLLKDEKTVGEAVLAVYPEYNRIPQ